jgi:hypothetical protein
LTEIPVFISRRVLAGRRRLPRAVGRYAIDSGGFTELQTYGRWSITAAQYVAFLRRCWRQIGPFDFAAPMDWMCEPWVISGGTVNGVAFAGTRLPVKWHQRQTVRNYLQLRTLAPELPIIPVLQGWQPDDYQRHVRMYASANVDLTAAPLVGLGSVCRRQNTAVAGHIIATLNALGVRRLHGFGFKVVGLRRNWHALASADSMAWSLDGRHAGPCTHPPHLRGVQPRSEANCLPYALAWRTRHIRPPDHTQTDLLVDLGAA